MDDISIPHSQIARFGTSETPRLGFQELFKE